MLDLNKPLHRELSSSVHQDLPRQAPGATASTLRALEMTRVPKQAQLLDIGCGTGRLDYWSPYPDMTTIATRQVQMETLGYSGIGAFVMPSSAWTDDYYDPMQARIDALQQQHAVDAEALAVLDACAEEIRVFESSAGSYGYAFLVMRRGARSFSA